jgi:ferredoxin
MSRHRILIEPAGLAFEAEPDQTVMDAALAAGVSLPRSCRNGTCRTCLCRLRSGDIDYRVEWPGVSFDEREDGWILPCVALALSDLVLDVPGAAQS